jgi:hypothetical protein
VKEKLLRLLENDPATAGRPSDFLDTLAEDIQAVIIRAIAPGQTEDEVAALEAAVEEVYHSDFGISLFNLYSIAEFPGKKSLYFSTRKALVRAAIQTILVEQSLLPDRREVFGMTSYSDVPPTDGPTLKRRLKEMAVKVPTAAIN